MSMQTPIKGYNKHKEIMIKNTYKPQNYQYRPKMNPPSSYLNHLLKPNGNNSPVSNSLNLNSHNITNSFNNEQQFNTFRSASKKNKKFITHYQNNSEYYNIYVDDDPTLFLQEPKSAVKKLKLTALDAVIDYYKAEHFLIQIINKNNF